MEAFLLTCLQSQFIISRISNNSDLSDKIKNDLTWEVKQVTNNKCNIDANRPKERNFNIP